MAARAQAAEATARAVSAAARALLVEQPYDAITLAAVAERAGVTVQTVLRRFGSKEALVAAAAAERSAAVRVEREAFAPGDVAGLVAHYERWGREQLHLLAQEDRVPAIRAMTDTGRAYHARWVEAGFGPRLEGLGADVRRRRLAQLTAVTDLTAWRVLREDQGLSPAETASAVRDLVDLLLDLRAMS